MKDRHNLHLNHLQNKLSKFRPTAGSGSILFQHAAPMSASMSLRVFCLETRREDTVAGRFFLNEIGFVDSKKFQNVSRVLLVVH
jgi:hypothetical protein